MQANDEAISVLNDLIETCKDGENGFKTAAEGIQDSALQAQFGEYSAQRARFAAELRNEVQRLGGDPEDSGSAAAAMHRGWINIKSAVTGRDEASIISECERGEDVAKHSYEKALQANLPASVRMIVERQYRDVKMIHDRVRALERATSHS